MAQQGDAAAGGQRSGLLGSLKDALAAAGRPEARSGSGQQADASLEAQPALAAPMQLPPPVRAVSPETAPAPVAAINDEAAQASRATGLSAAEAARSARGEALGASGLASSSVPVESPPTTRVVKAAKNLAAAAGGMGGAPAQTQLLRGKQKVTRGGFESDPVVGWLVIVGGPGIGAFRPIFEGNNTLGRASNQRIALDFGDDAISSEEQAYIRYDSSDRSFLFVPNLAKTNVVSLNDKRPTGAVELRQMDVIVIGRTQLVFVPFCGADFDWSELAEPKS